MNIKQLIKFKKTSIFYELCHKTFKFFLTIRKIMKCINLLAKKGQFLFYRHVQVLVSAVHKPKHTWSVESFSEFAMLTSGLLPKNTFLNSIH